MRKLFAALMALCLVLTFCVCAFATGDDIQSPTDKPVYSVEVVSYETDPPSRTSYTVSAGDTLQISAPANAGDDFLGFTIQGDYEIVSGSLAGPELVIRPLSDVIVVANYRDSGNTPTTPTNPSGSGENSPQTDGTGMVYVVAVMAAVALVGITLTAVKLRTKKNEE